MSEEENIQSLCDGPTQPMKAFLCVAFLIMVFYGLFTLWGNCGCSFKNIPDVEIESISRESY